MARPALLVRADDRLIEVDDRAGHQARPLGEQERDHLRDLGRFDQPAERLPRFGPFEPVVAAL